jgi:hypothetical protein
VQRTGYANPIIIRAQIPYAMFKEGLEPLLTTLAEKVIAGG